MARRPDVLWKAYSLATGFAADVAALAVSAAVSDEVSAILGGIFVTAAILELAPFVALVWAATAVIYLPLHLIRSRRAVAGG